MIPLAEYESFGRTILAKTDQSIPRFLILRDVLNLPKEETTLQSARAVLKSCSWVQELERTQHSNGSWGRFHSRDSSLKQRFPTTELALYRARALGLDKFDPLNQKTIYWMEMILQGQTDWSDPDEKHEGWTINKRFITAATLALVDPSNPLIHPLAERWVEVVKRTFQKGAYDPIAERQAHREINGIHTRGKYLKLAALYPLVLLSVPSVKLDNELESSFLNWVCQKADGIYYVYGRSMLHPPELTNAHFQNWLDGVSLLSRFKFGRLLCSPAINWLWAQREDDGLWDFGPSARRQLAFPLSESWRNLIDRKIDSSISVLQTLRSHLSG